MCLLPVAFNRLLRFAGECRLKGVEPMKLKHTKTIYNVCKNTRSEFDK